MSQFFLTYLIVVKHLLNKLDATFEQSCMATSRDKYYTEMFRTLTY